MAFQKDKSPRANKISETNKIPEAKKSQKSETIQENMSKTRLYKHAYIITFFTLLSRILGSVRDLVISHIFGANFLTDAFIQAFTIPNVMRRLTAEGGMTLAFIPLYAELREKQGIEKARLFAQKTLGLVLWGTLFFTALGMIFSEQLVYLFATGFVDSPEVFELTVDLTRLMFPYLMMVSIVAWAMGVLNSEKRFAVPAAAPIFLNVGIIGAAFFLSSYFEQPIVALGWGVLIGGVIQVFLQVPALRKIGQSIRPLSFFKDENIRQLLKLLAPSLLGIGVYQFNIIILRNIASFLPQGQITYYYNASRLSEFVLGVFAFAFTTATFPELSTQMARENWQKFFETLRFTLESTMFIVLPAMAGLVVAAEPIISMMYLHGKFQFHDVQQTAVTLQAFALSIPALAAIRFLIPTFYAFKDTKTPVLVSTLSLFVTGSLGFWWSQSLEVVGLALGLSAGTWFQMFLLLFFLYRKPNFNLNWVPKLSLLKYFLVSCGMAALAWQISQWGEWNLGLKSGKNWLVFIGLLISAALFYFLILVGLKDGQALSWKKNLRKLLAPFNKKKRG